MATFYVNKSGNNGNSGATAVLAKLTIQAAVTAAATSDTIIVGSGEYVEKITVSNKVLTFLADGVVVISGRGLVSGNLFTISSSGTLTTITFNSLSQSGKFIFRENTGSYLISATDSAATTINVICYNCEFYFQASSSNIAAIFLQRNGSTVLSLYAYKCLFVGAFTYSVQGATNSITFDFYFCTFYGSGIGLYSASNNRAVTCLYNIFHTVTTAIYHIQVSFTAGTTFNQNQYYNVTSFVFNGTLTFAQWQALGYDALSVTSNPAFVDVTNNIFYPTVAHPITGIIQLGYLPYGFVHGAAYNPNANWNIVGAANNTGWYVTSGTITQDASNYFQLPSGTSGTIISPVYDIGYTTSITQVDVSNNNTWPTNMVDTTTSDIRPNYQTIEIRASTTSFNMEDVSPSWQEINEGVIISAITGRYVQLRLTLRNNDVAA